MRTKQQLKKYFFKATNGSQVFEKYVITGSEQDFDRYVNMCWFNYQVTLLGFCKVK